MPDRVLQKHKWHDKDGQLPMSLCMQLGTFHWIKPVRDRFKTKDTFLTRINTDLPRKCQRTAEDIGKNRLLAWASIGSFLSLIITDNKHCRYIQYKLYLNPFLLFSISFVSFGFKAFPTVFLVFTDTLHVSLIVVTPEQKRFLTTVHWSASVFKLCNT